MKWHDFYEEFWGWSLSECQAGISALEDIGPGEEVVCAILAVPNEQTRARLARKAIELGAVLSAGQLQKLEGELIPKVYRELQEHICPEPEPHPNGKSGPAEARPEEDAVPPAQKALPPLPLQGQPAPQKPKSGPGIPEILIGSVLGVFAFALGVIFNLGSRYSGSPRRPRSHGGHRGHGRSHSRLCDGDCANCPAHYGYRYGRWYYGHGHQWGCERHGNGGAAGRTYRD
ncbi:MAG: hypothetical protein IIV90_02860 [Oscillospiraceae bacterium]|nr:hypothetical protein [Oscillospiraceae bacterium]